MNTISNPTSELTTVTDAEGQVWTKSQGITFLDARDPSKTLSVGQTVYGERRESQEDDVWRYAIGSTFLNEESYAAERGDPKNEEFIRKAAVHCIMDMWSGGSWFAEWERTMVRDKLNSTAGIQTFDHIPYAPLTDASSDALTLSKLRYKSEEEIEEALEPFLGSIIDKTWERAFSNQTLKNVKQLCAPSEGTNDRHSVNLLHEHYEKNPPNRSGEFYRHFACTNCMESSTSRGESLK